MTNGTNPNAESFDTRIAQAVENIVRPLHQALEKEVASVVQELATSLAGDHAAALEEARDAAAAEKEAAVRDAVAAVSADHEVVLNDMTRVALAERDAAVKDAQAAAEAAVAAAVAEALSRARADAEGAMAAARNEAASQIETMRSEAQASLAAARSEADRQLADRLAEADARAATDLEASLTGALASERQADLAWIDGLIATIRSIDQARSMGEVLDALAGDSLVPSGRIAVLLVRDGKLRGWRFTGFDEFVGDAHAIELSLDDTHVVARAISGHDCASTSNRELLPEDVPVMPPASLLHLPSGRASFAAPVCVAGQVVAVVYADGGTGDVGRVPNPWPEIVEIVARHASRCLELLMAARIAAWTRASAAQSAADPGGATASSSGRDVPPLVRAAEDEDAARRYARLLISEIKLYHESDVNQGKRERDLLQRLRPEIDRARRLYEERVPPDVRVRTGCFDEELVRTLADGNASLLGQAT